jgi:isoquinoline 1-oxidoreductase alpha subunit
LKIIFPGDPNYVKLLTIFDKFIKFLGTMAELTVNGKRLKFKSDKDMPLLWVLRDELNLKGTKFGCGKGLCGACTVIVDGEPVRSCLIPAGTLNGKKINTIEGLSANGDHILQKAWKEFNVPQCGYCQPGQIMSAAGLLNSNPRPSDSDIDTAMSGNICRCGTYPRIRAAIKWAAKNRGK